MALGEELKRLVGAVESIEEGETSETVRVGVRLQVPRDGTGPAIARGNRLMTISMPRPQPVLDASEPVTIIIMRGEEV